jgi:photosystem II stability/assembly factor-like uncharacterized protein
MRRVVNRSSVAAVAAVICLGGGLTLAARAAQQAPAGPPPGVDPALLSTFKWRSIGPERGGRSIAISGVKGHPELGYFGATGGGLWKTTDRGASWTPVTDGQLHSSSVGAVAVSETNPDVVFIGTGESCIRGNIQPGDGVYKSTDAGKTWTRIGFEHSDAISKIRIDPTNADIVFVADFGKYSVPSAERGVYKSTDGGKTWKQVLFRDNNTGAVDLWIDRNNPKVIFAAMWEAFRKEYTMSSGGPGSGLFKSTDGGDTWTEITHNPGLPAGIDGKIGVTVSGADSTRVYALVENANGGVFVSNDAGATWALANRQRDLRQRAFYYTHITADPHNKDLVYAQDVGTWKSSDGGKTFSQYAGSDSHDIWIDPDDSNHFMYANDGGGTETFTALAQPIWSTRAYASGQFYHVITTAHVPYHVCGAQQDSSTICVPSDEGLAGGGGRRGGGGGGGGRGAGGAPADPLANTYGAGGAEPGYIAPDPNDPDIYYAGGNNGSFLTKINRRTGENREVGPYPLEFSGQASKDLVERVQWTFPIIFSQVDTHVLFTGTQHLWRSINGGQSWDKLGGDALTRHDPSTMSDSGGPITHDMNSPEVYATVFAIGPGKTDVNVVWTGSDDGIVSVTKDGGKTFANVTPKDMPDFGRVSIIDASKFDAASAYVAVKKPLLDDQKPYIFRTHDFGKTWTKIVTGLGPTDYVHTVREDPNRKGLLYAGTQHGVYYSYNDGDTWRSLSLNLPDVQISDLWVEANDLAIATHGRGFYILDNVGPIRQYGAEFVNAKSVYLFKPNAAIRSATTATIAYWVKDAPQSMTIDIVDPKGNVAHAFAMGGGAAGGGRGGGGGRASGGGRAAGAGAGGGAPAPVAGGGGSTCAPGAGGGGFGGRGGRGGAATGPDPLPTAPGLNCVNWSLRYANAIDFPNDIMWGGGTTGPLAAPGTYQVKLTVDGVTQTQSLVVKRHPLYKDVTDADLQEQFDLAIQVRDKVSEANQAVIDIRHVKTEVADRLTKSQDAGLKAAGDKLTTNLSAVEQDIYQVKNEAGQDPLNFPIKTNNRLGALLEMIGHGDGKPIGNAPVVFRDLSVELKGETDRLARVVATDLVAFNAEAKRLGLTEVTLK